MIKRILVGLGGTPYTTSEIRHALDLAQVHRAEITAITVVDLPRVSNVGPIPIGGSAAASSLVHHRLEVTQHAIDEAVATFKDACADAGVKHHVISGVGDPFDELISLWRYHDITVLALQSLFEYGVVQDPKDMLVQLIARGVRPILAVAKEYRPIKRVLVGYNGSMESAKAMKYFSMLGLWPDVEMKIVCFEIPEDQAKALLRDAAEYSRLHGHHPQTEVLPGTAAQNLLKHAEDWQADMIVLGSTARARIFRHLLGDTALHLVRNAEIPLFMTQ